MLVAFTCICCDLDFEDNIPGISDAEEVTDDLLPQCPECMSAGDVTVNEDQPGDYDVELDSEDFTEDFFDDEFEFEDEDEDEDE